MTKHILTLLKDKILYIAILVTLGILFLSLIKLPNISLGITYTDKFYHTFAYFVLTISWLLSFYKKPHKKYLITFLCLLFGIIIEALQFILTNYRTGDYLDVLANSLGIVLGLLFFNYTLKKLN